MRRAEHLAVLNRSWASVDAIAMAVLIQHHGVAKLSTFLAAGLTANQVAAQHRRAVLNRPRNGWYVDPELPWQAKCAVRVGGVLACVSALDSFGLPVPPEPGRRVHALVPANAPRRRHNRDSRRYVEPGEDPEVEVHWSRTPGQQIGWRTPLVDALVLAADCLPPDWWVAAADAALHRPRGGTPLLTEDDWNRIQALLPPRHRRLPDQVDPRSESCIETLLRLAMIRRGIGPIVLQFEPDGFRRVDFLLPGKLIVEADGEEFHDEEEDRIRDARFRRLGYRVLRFSYKRIVEDIDRVLDEIEAALA